MKGLSLITILSALILSCAKPVILDLPLYDDKPVVNCLFTPEEPFMVHVSTTGSKFDTMLFDVYDASVKIYQDEMLLKELPLIGEGFYSDSTLFPEIGKSYTLKINVPGYDEVSATDSVPSTFSEFTYKGFEEDAWFDEDGEGYNALTFEIDDREADNFFEVLFRANYSRYDSWNDSIRHYFWMAHFRLFSPMAEAGQGRAVFTDQQFNGTKYTLQLMSGSDNGQWHADSLNLNVQVLQGSQNFYTYRTTLFKHQYAQYSDFFEPTEPVIMYSNIENGYGVFAAYRSKFYPLIFTDSE